MIGVGSDGDNRFLTVATAHAASVRAVAVAGGHAPLPDHRLDVARAQGAGAFSFEKSLLHAAGDDPAL